MGMRESLDNLNFKILIVGCAPGLLSLFIHTNLLMDLRIRTVSSLAILKLFFVQICNYQIGIIYTLARLICPEDIKNVEQNGQHFK